MKKLIFSIFALLCALSMNAQEVCGYTAKSVQGIYADLIGGTIVNTAAADTTKAYDGMCYALDGEGKILAQKEMTDVAGFPIGFEFNYLGKKFTHFGICANGYVVLGTADQKLTFKANNSWYGYNGVPYAIGLYNNTRFTRVGADQLQISYKSTSSALCIEFKNVLLSGESKLTKEDALDPTKATLWSYQLQISKDGTIAWAVKGLAEDTKSGSISMALTEKVYEYVGFTSYSKTDFLTNPVAEANSCSTTSTIKATPEGTKVVFVGAPDVVAPKKNAVDVKIDDKKSSQDGYYTFRVTIGEPEEGDAEAYMMLVSKDAEPDTNPADGTAYVEGDSVGNSKVYASSGTVHNLYGMVPGVYYAKAFAYNKIGAKGPKYLIEGAPMASVATPKAGTTAPDSLWVRTTAATSIGLGVKGNAAGQTIIVAMCDSTYNPGNYGVRPYPGNLSAASKKNDPILDENGKQVGKVVYVGVPNATNGTTFTASSLKASTPYYFVAYASDGEQLAWDPDFVQVWATTAITVPYSVAMNKAPENNQPVGWTSEPGGEYEGFYVTQANVGGDALHPSTISVLMGLNTRFKANDYIASLTSPSVTLTKDCKYTFKWRMDENGNWGMAGAGHGPENWVEEGEYLKFEVICDGDTTLAKNYTYENAPECLANKEWVNDVIDLSAYSGKDVQVKMTWRSPFTKGVKMYLDSLTFEQYAVAPTMAPSLKFTKRHMTSSFELKADIVESSEPADGYVMLVSKNAAPDTTPVDGVTYEDKSTLGNAELTIHSGRLLTKNIQKPEEGATYYVAVYAYNGGNGGPKYLIEGAPLASTVIPSADLVAPAELKALDEQKYTDKISFSVKANEANQTVIVAYSDSTCNPGNYGSQAAVGEINPATAKAGDQLYDASGNPCGKIAYVGATGEFTVEGLLPSTSYYFTAFSANDKAVSWSPDYINCWAATKGVAPYEVNMAAAPVRDLPAGWTSTPEGENKGFYKNSNGLTKNLPPSGNPDVFYSTAPSALDEETHTATLTSPVISLTNGNTLSFDWLTLMWGRFSNTGYGPSAWMEEDTIKVELIDGENVVTLKSYDYETAPACLDNQVYVSENFDLSAYAGKDVQFRIVWHSVVSSQVYMYIDAFKVNAPQATIYYSQDYENGATSDWSTQVGGRFDPEIGEDASGNHYLRAAAGTRTANGTGMYSNAYNEKLAAGTPFTMTADIHLRSANGQNGTEFTVGAAGASYNFSKWTLTGTMTLNMKQVSAGGTNQWILNGDADHPITLPGTETLAGTDAAVIYDEAPWYSIMLSWKDGLTFFSIKDKATGEVIVDKQQLKSNDSFASVGGVGQLWFSTSRYNAAFAIDNVVIRDIIDGDLPVIIPTTYTLNYVHEGDGAILKDPVVLNTTVGTEVTASSADMASFFNADKSMKYIYKEGNTTIVASEDSAANVITLVYRDAAMLKYTVKSTGLPEGIEIDFTPYANPGDKFAEQWEGELVSVAYPQFVMVGDSLWTCPVGKYVAKTFNKEWTITAASKETVEYTDNYTIMNVTAGSKFNKLKDIVYYKEGEEIWPGECLAPNQYVRCSYGKAGAPALNEKAEIVTLPAGTYRVGMQFAQATTAAQKETYDLFLGEDTLFKAAIYGYVQSYQSPEFTITEDTKLYLKGLTVDGGGLDWIYVQKVVREEATIEFAGESTVMHVGDENPLTFDYTNSGATITYTSSNPEVGVVSEDGKFTAISVGKTVITATLAATDYTYAASTQVVIKVREVPVPVTTIREWDFSKISTAYAEDYAAMKANEEYWEGTGDYRMFLKKAVLNEELTSNGAQKLSFADGIIWTADAWKILVGDGSENYEYIQIQKGAEFYIPNVGANDTIKFVGYAPSTSGSLEFYNCEPSAIDFHWGGTYESYQVVVTATGEFDFKAPQDFRLQSIVIIPEGEVYTGSNDPTGINDISAKNAQFFGEGTYDLSGRKVMNPVKGNVYIVNGKKYLCK